MEEQQRLEAQLAARAPSLASAGVSVPETPTSATAANAGAGRATFGPLDSDIAPATAFVPMCGCADGPVRGRVWPLGSGVGPAAGGCRARCGDQRRRRGAAACKAPAPVRAAGRERADRPAADSAGKGQTAVPRSVPTPRPDCRLIVWRGLVAAGGVLPGAQGRDPPPGQRARCARHERSVRQERPVQVFRRRRPRGAWISMECDCARTPL